MNNGNPAEDSHHRVVVVVDDALEVREMYAAHLEEQGFTVARAANGVEALFQIKRVRPSSVVLDLLMPRLGGLEVLSEIKAFDPSIRVVVVTGAEDPTLRQRALDCGATAFLKKPFEPETLLSALTDPSA